MNAAQMLGANLAWAIGVGVLERQKTEAGVTAEACRMARIHGVPAYVYRTPHGTLRASTLAPDEVMPGYELVQRVTSLKNEHARASAKQHPLLKRKPNLPA